MISSGGGGPGGPGAADGGRRRRVGSMGMVASPHSDDKKERASLQER